MGLRGGPFVVDKGQDVAFAPECASAPFDLGWCGAVGAPFAPGGAGDRDDLQDFRQAQQSVLGGCSVSHACLLS